MIFAAPMPFEEALDAQEVKSILRTSAKSRDLRGLEGSIKRRATFSATQVLAEPLKKIRDGVDALLTGQADQATVRLGLKQLYESIGYAPDPEKAGGLEDHASTRRLNLILETNVQVAQGQGWREQGMQADVLDEFPAQELYRAFGPRDTSAQRDWAER